AISSLALAFSDQTVSTTSQQQSVVITNTGNTPVSISNIVASGDFSLGGYNYCIGTLQPSASYYYSSCSFAVTFTPTAAGARTGAVAITDNAVGGPHIVDRKSTRLNSSHVSISYAVFCMQKKNIRRAQVADCLRHTL